MTLFDKLHPSVQKQYKIRMAIAIIVLAISIIFTAYIFTIGEYKRLPLVGSISEKEVVQLQKETESTLPTGTVTEYGTVVK